MDNPSREMTELDAARRFLTSATSDWGKRFWSGEIARLEMAIKPAADPDSSRRHLEAFS